MADGDGESPEWVASLPEGIRDWDEVKNSDSPEKFWSQVENMRSRLGSSIRIPSEEAGEDDLAEFYGKLSKVDGVTRIPSSVEDTQGWAALYQKMGRPEGPEGYDFDGDPAQKTFLHGLGLNTAQARRVVENLQSVKTEERTLLADKVKQQHLDLDAEWGEAKSRKVAAISKVLDKHDPDGKLREVLMGEQHPDFPAADVLRVLAGIGDLYLEGGEIEGGPSGGWGITPDEARERAREIRENPNSPRNNPMHPQHRRAKEEYSKLFDIANGIRPG